MLTNKKILITGASGTVARPVAEALAANNEVWCLGRFGDPQVRAALLAKGIKLFQWDLGLSSLDGLPGGFTHVFHSAVIKNVDDFNSQVDRHAFATAQLMTHCRDGEAFIFVSASSVYRRLDFGHLHKETDPLGDSSPLVETYSTHKNGAEAVVRALARVYGLRSIIARLSVTYGPVGYGGLPATIYAAMSAGKPMPVRASPEENWCSPMHTDDVVRQVPLLWEAASVPATAVNWGGDEAIRQQDMIDYIAEITGIPVLTEVNPRHRMSCAFDNTLRQKLIGKCEVPWREGVRRTLEARFPGAVKR